MKVLIRLIVSFFVFIVDVVYGNRSYARFYMLETIARVPYFSYVSVLHLYETLGYWRKADLLKLHFAETWNELHHLLIMESLGGDRHWIDRFIAQHVAVAYYWVVVLIYMVFPSYAYYLMELIEGHAYHTYDEYLKTYEAQLKAQRAPQVAINFYRDGDLYMFDEVQTAPGHEFRRPKVDNLYDVFVNIRDDESEHVKTMVALQKPEARLTFKSPHTVFEAIAAITEGASLQDTRSPITDKPD
jgi:ubiquinol oxidase